MSELMIGQTKQMFHDTAAPLIDAAVGEIFGMMLGMEATVIDSCAIRDGKELVSAIVGFAGVMTGNCIIQMHESTALRVTGAMLGTTLAEMNDSVKDAVGEVANMVAGGWKNKLPEVASQCLLSVPTVVTGDSYEMYYSPNSRRIMRVYGFDGMCMNVIMLVEVAE
jgi:chemotaxis protein CheX